MEALTMKLREALDGYDDIDGAVEYFTKLLIDADELEFFEDRSYYDMICVRPKGNRAFGDTIHVNTYAEAAVLIKLIEAAKK